MSDIHSPRWYRVAQLKPRLTGEILVRRLHLRAQTWYLLSQRNGGRSVRLNRSAYALAGRLNGAHSLQQIWDHLLTGEQDPATQDEVIDIIVQLQGAGLLQLDRPGDTQRLMVHLERITKPPRRGNALAWRFTLGDPSAILARLAPVRRLLFNHTALVCWVAAVLLLVVLALQNASGLIAHAEHWLATPRFAMLAVALYVPLKAIHELAHGLAVQKGGGYVHKAGVTFMLGMPVPWVDASAATAFVRRRDRVLVGAAGMMAELTLAAIALPLWLLLGDGLARDTAFVVVCIAGVSTLMFNANPLQRLDGYYILSDAMELPNLATRSQQWWQDTLRRRLLASHAAEPMSTAPGETRWLAAYAPLAWAYTLFLGVLATTWLGKLSAALGLLAGALLLWQMVLRPIYQFLGALRRASLAQESSASRWRRATTIATAVLISALLMPVPQRTTVQGIVWPGEKAQLRADEDGFVSDLLVANGAAVQPGDTVLRLSNPVLSLHVQTQLARVAALESEYLQNLPGLADRQPVTPTEGRLGNLQAELASANAALARAQERVAALDVKAHSAGRVALFEPGDLQDRFFSHASLIGQVIDATPANIRAAVPESQARELNTALQSVQVRLAASPWQEIDARSGVDTAGASQQLPNAALSQRHGGTIATDPLDPDDRKAVSPVILIDVQLNGAADLTKRLGERAWIRFDYGYAPLAWQIALGLRRAVLRQFNPQA